MNNDHGCYYVDGSYLFASIERIKHDHPELKDCKLNIAKLALHLQTQFGSNFHSSLRVVYYFRTKDPRIKEKLTIPPIHGQRGHWQIKECGTNVKGIKPIPATILDKLPEKYRDLYPRAEKGLDMELACDALLLAAGGRVECFVFIINDRDYIPLLNSIQRLGANTYLAGLDAKQKIQDSLLNLADRYVTLESYLHEMFDYVPPIVESELQLLGTKNPK